MLSPKRSHNADHIHEGSAAADEIAQVVQASFNLGLCAVNYRPLPYRPAATMKVRIEIKMLLTSKNVRAIMMET